MPIIEVETSGHGSYRKYKGELIRHCDAAVVCEFDGTFAIHSVPAIVVRVGNELIVQPLSHPLREVKVKFLEEQQDANKQQ